MHNFASKTHQPCKNRADAPIPIDPARFLTAAPGKNRLCVVRGISGCGAAAAHGCVFRMSLVEPFPLERASPALRLGRAVRHTPMRRRRGSVPPLAGGSSRPPESTCHHVCASGSDGTTSTERRRVRSSSLTAEKKGGPPLAPNMLTCCRPAQRLGGTSHYEGSTPGRGGKLNPMFTKSHALSSYRRRPTQHATDVISGEALVCLF